MYEACNNELTGDDDIQHAFWADMPIKGGLGDGSLTWLFSGELWQIPS